MALADKRDPHVPGQAFSAGGNLVAVPQIIQNLSREQHSRSGNVDGLDQKESIQPVQVCAVVSNQPLLGGEHFSRVGSLLASDTVPPQVHALDAASLNSDAHDYDPRGARHRLAAGVSKTARRSAERLNSPRVHAWQAKLDHLFDVLP